MSADGTWKLVMQTPIGDRKATLVLAVQGSSLSGTMTSDEGASTGVLGTTSGDDVSFSASIKSPMPLTLQFVGKVAGSGIAGTVSASGVGSWPFSGTKG